MAEKEKNRPNMLIKPLWVTARPTNTPRGMPRDRRLPFRGSRNTSPDSTRAQPRVNRAAGRYFTPTIPALW